MSGQIFISYRRDDSSASAGRLYDRLLPRLPKNHIFIDVDLDPGIDFVEAIETSVSSCDILIAVIGKRWLLSSVGKGKRRLENPEDFVRVEIATALKRKIRVIPVLVDGASMPRPSDLPDDLKLLARLNALEVSHNRFNADFGRLVTAIERVLERAEAEGKQREGKERLQGERLETELRPQIEERDEGRLEKQSSYPRPMNWYCTFCGWKCTETFNDYICKSCEKLRPFAGGSATMIQCKSCKQMNLALASFCEWCGNEIYG
jgi:TIR domain